MSCGVLYQAIKMIILFSDILSRDMINDSYPMCMWLHDVGYTGCRNSICSATRAITASHDNIGTADYNYV